ncbi:hypothetical protein HN011_000262 [Eciton burchellii]|nr:hypothetical protein HN011_000262 [Eciton burchellii]
MLAHAFEIHGRFCARHPFEVIMATITLTVCMLNIDTGNVQPRESLPDGAYCYHGCDTMEAADIIIMTIIRCLAVLFTYYQFRNLQKMGSKYILGISGLFIVFCSVIFTSGIVNFGRSDVADLKDALFFFLLLIDLTKAAMLARYALTSRNQEEVEANIARGMSLLGPTITLDTLVETLLIGVGSLSGVRRLEVLCSFACLGVIVNYVIFMTFYPACLSVILEHKNNYMMLLENTQRNSEETEERQNEVILSRENNMSRLSADKIFMIESLNQDQKSNPVVERVKMIMIAGLFVVHANSRWPFKNEENEHKTEPIGASINSNIINGSNHTESSERKEHFMAWLSISAQNIVILILLLALTVKFIFFEDKNNVVVNKQHDEEKKLITKKKEKKEHDDSADRDNTNTIGTDMSVIEAVFPPCGEWIENPVERANKEIQTDAIYLSTSNSNDESELLKKFEIPRSLEDCIEIYKSKMGASVLTDNEVIQLVNYKHIPAYQLEKAVDNMERGVGIRRRLVAVAGKFTNEMDNLPYKNYDYSKVLGSCCENVIGYVPVPVGIAGPLILDGQKYHVPMATTEGCLLASTNRGCRALEHGVTSRVVGDGMTRGPVVRFPNIVRASEAMSWMQQPENFQKMKDSFDETSRFARLRNIHVRIAGRYLFIRFAAKTGDAMGMNMLSKGTEKSLHTTQTYFPDMQILSLSGNFCTDKKPAAVNWIEGRGKSVVCEAVVSERIVTNVLKTTVDALIDVNLSKNMIGSAMAGSIGGFNAHAANIVTAIFIATGQDPAQNVGSSNCMTLMEPWGEEGRDLYISCTMPSIEVGTVGGGTGLPAQEACLAMLGAKGAHSTQPGKNANKLASIVCATVLAGELSLMAALTAGHLVKSHLRHNRSSVSINNSVRTCCDTYSDRNQKLMVPSILPKLSQDDSTDFKKKPQH